MTLLNQYHGATRSILGASYLDTKAILNIQEGYQIGATTEYVDLGNFEVENFANTGVFSQKLKLNAHNPVRRLDYNNTIVARSFENHHVWYDDFSDSDTLQRNYQQFDSGWEISSGNLKYDMTDTPNDRDNIAYVGNQTFDDFRIIVKIRCNTFDTDYDSRISILFNTQDFTRLNKNGYGFELMGENVNLLRAIKFTDDAAALLDSTAFNPADDTWYWLMVIKRGNRIMCYSSTDGQSYTSRYDITDNTYSGGGIGLYCRSGDSSTEFLIDFIDIVEIGNQYSTKDIIKHSLAMGGVFDTWIQPELNGVSGFEASAGSCWVVGNTNGYQQVDLYNTQGGSLYHTYTSAGNTFNNFIFECEVKGLSGNWLGLMTGSTATFYTNYYKFIGTASDVRNNIDNIISGGRNVYAKRGLYLNLQSSQWYKIKLIKTNLFLAWYVNDVLSNSIYGTSLPESDGEDNNVGIVGWEGGVTIYRSSFRNAKISKLDDLVDDVQINPNTPLSSVFSRYLPNGYAVNWSGSTVEIFEVGASKGEFGVCQYIQDSSEDISNIVGDKNVLARGENSIGLASNTNDRVVGQLDSTRVKFIQDPNIQSNTDGENIANADIVATNRNIQPYSCSITPRVDMEQYDTVNLVDAGLGISKKMLVQGFNKSYSAGDGSFRQTLQLVEK